MKKILVLAATLVLVSSSAFAALTATLDVTATVTSSCSVTGGTLAFGVIDTLAVGDKTATAAAVTVTCTGGTPYTVSDDAATNPLTDVLLNTIPFTLSYPAGATGVGTGVAQVIDITGTISEIDYSAAFAGAYASTVTLTVTP